MRTLLGILLLAAVPGRTQPCDVSAPAKAALDALPASGADRAAAARKLRDQFPTDYFVHGAYQDATWARGVSSPEIQAEYRTLKDAHPDDPLFATLYARAMTGAKTTDTISHLNAVLAKHADYAYAHQKLAEIYSSSAFRDDAEFQEHIRAYRRACPASIEAWRTVGRADDPAFLKESAAGLRKLIDGQSDLPAMLAYATLWTMEFKVEPLAQQASVRERIRQDVARLRAMDLAKYPALWDVLAQGYKVLADGQGTKWVEEHDPNRAPADAHQAARAIRAWREDHPKKPAESNRDYQARIVKQADEWIRQYPGESAPLREKFIALRGMLDAPLEEIVPVAEEWIKVYEAHPSDSPPYLTVAQFYATRNLKPDQLPELLEKALKDVKDPEPPSLSDLVAPGSASRFPAYMVVWGTWSSAADIYIKIKQYDKARAILTKVWRTLEDGKPAETAADSEARLYKQIIYQYWTSMTALAHAENHPLDELVFLRNSVAASPMPSTETSRQYYLKKQRDLWNSLGGTDEAFDAFLHPVGEAAKSTAPTRPAIATPSMQWTTADRPLPEFSIADASGRTWTLADFKGKITLVNIWATWCGPCRKELPYLQKLFEKLRDRKDFQVLTLNADANPGLIAPFLEETKYTFPVLPAFDYVRNFLSEVTIPRNWIVDSQGVLRQERLGFTPASGDKWIDEIVALMEKSR